jgi:Flp pilus assembly protein TadG
MTNAIAAAGPRLRRDVRGNAAIMFGLCMLPMVGAIGLGVDYLSSLSHKARLDAAADAAAIGAITTAQNYITSHQANEAEPGLTTHAKAAGEAQGARAFALNAGSTLASVPTTPAVHVDRSAQTLTATVSYATQAKSNFGSLFGVKAINVGGNAASSLTMGSYLDFYLALDVSGSMGLPTNVDDQTTLANANGGCQFACHFVGQSQGLTIARARKIKLRVDSVGTAVSHLVATAKATQTLPNQYRVGAYPFIVDVMEAAPLSYDLTGAAAVGSALGDVYLDQGMAYAPTRRMGSGGTHFENLLPDMQPFVRSAGNGLSSASPKPFLFVVTDGADNSQTYDGANWHGGSNPMEPNNFGYCDYAKQIGVTIAILYVPYLPINNSPPEDQAESTAVNGIIKSIPGDLKKCASDNFFFTANTDADIDGALQAMFNQALQAARLVK